MFDLNIQTILTRFDFDNKFNENEEMKLSKYSRITNIQTVIDDIFTK